MNKNIILATVLIIFFIFVFWGDDKNKYEGQFMEVKVYLYSEALDQGPGGVECSSKGLVPVTRSIPMSDDRIGDSIKLLLSGSITEEDRLAKLSTEFPLDGVTLKRVKTKDEIAYLTFSDPKNKTSGGSCRVSILRAQIEATAKQFRSAKEVKILPEEVFQP